MKILRICLILSAIISACICGYVVFKSIIEWYKKRRLSNYGIDSSKDYNNNYFAWLVRNGVSFLKKPSKFLLKQSKFIRTNISNIVSLLNEANLQCDGISILSASILLSFICGIVASLIFASFIAGIALILCIFVLIITISRSFVDKRITNLRNSIPDTLRSMSTCFGAGYTIFQTFSHISSESKGAVKNLFGKCVHILQTGGSVSSSLDCLKNVKEVPELSFLAVALDVQHQTGGSMKPVIESAKDMVENKLELMRMLQVQTAQAKLSARIVMVLPFALILIFSMISPGFLMPFFSSIFGFILLLIACLMQTAGIILVKKMLDVEI